MFKKFRKMTTLALVLALILTVSASAFAAETFSEVWFAPDYVTTVDASAEIEAHRTHGEIHSASNIGDVYIEYYYDYYLDNHLHTLVSDINNASDLDDAYVDSGDIGAYTMYHAYYTFFAYVPTDLGESWYEPDTVVLEYPTWVN